MLPRVSTERNERTKTLLLHCPASVQPSDLMNEQRPKQANEHEMLPEKSSSTQCIRTRHGSEKEHGFGSMKKHSGFESFSLINCCF